MRVNISKQALPISLHFTLLSIPAHEKVSSCGGLMLASMQPAGASNITIEHNNESIKNSTMRAFR